MTGAQLAAGAPEEMLGLTQPPNRERTAHDMRQYDLTTPITIDVDQARTWVERIASDPSAADAAWVGWRDDFNPVTPGFETTLNELLVGAQAAGIIGGTSIETVDSQGQFPALPDLWFDYSDDEDGGGYGYCLRYGTDLTVKTDCNEMRKIDGRDQTDPVDAAVAFLTGSIEDAELLRRRTAAFVTTQNAGAIPHTVF